MACFADINVSQGSVATCVKCGGILIPFNYKFTQKSSGEFLKIGLDLTELWPRVCGPALMAHPGEQTCLRLLPDSVAAAI